jgi:hypothetical protein
MPTLTFYPLGNADCCRIDLTNGEKLLFDYADMRSKDDPSDKRVDLPVVLREDLVAAKRADYDVVAFTHLDNDHVCGAGEFFEFAHAAKYQGNGRMKIRDLWVPAFAITETKNDICEDGKIIQAEARHRLIKGEGVRVFSRPELLKAWLAEQGLSLDARRALITDAGQLVPGWSKQTQGVEFFVHSPFASRLDDNTFIDRNTNSLVFQATFLADGRETRVLLMADSEHEILSEIVRITRLHKREERLEWDLTKLPHHCSYLSLGPDKGVDKTTPVPNVAWLYEKQGHRRSCIVSTSDPIPKSGDQIQPPHRQAANYYRDCMDTLAGDFMVTMEHPSASAPRPLEITIDGLGMTVRKPSPAIGSAATISRAPRAG